MGIVILDLSLSELLHNCSDFGPADVWWGFFFVASGAALLAMLFRLLQRASLDQVNLRRPDQ